MKRGRKVTNFRYRAETRRERATAKPCAEEDSQVSDAMSQLRAALDDSDEIADQIPAVEARIAELKEEITEIKAKLEMSPLQRLWERIRRK